MRELNCLFSAHPPRGNRSLLALVFPASVRLISLQAMIMPCCIDHDFWPDRYRVHACHERRHLFCRNHWITTPSTWSSFRYIINICGVKQFYTCIACACKHLWNHIKESQTYNPLPASFRFTPHSSRILFAGAPTVFFGIRYPPCHIPPPA